MPQLLIKRFIDLFIGFFGFILLFPIFFIVMILLFIANQGTPFFFQKRPGKNEKIFTIIKFKTMNDKKDENGKPLPDEKRLTPIGYFVRKASLDEIPQLLNVLKGDMSLIGPRPLLIEYLPLYNERQKKRHLVKPGITGLAQINGRNALSWQEKLEIDVQYVENMSFKEDCRIGTATVMKTFKREGINKPGTATTENFKGNPATQSS